MYKGVEESATSSSGLWHAHRQLAIYQDWMGYLTEADKANIKCAGQTCAVKNKTRQKKKQG